MPQMGRGGSRGLFLDDSLNDEYSGPPVFDEEPSNDVPIELFGDVGQLLVLRHTCLSPKLPDEQTDHHLLFESNSTIGGCVYHFIIDSGTCENVIAAAAIDKLSLSPEAHLIPYHLAWLEQGNKTPG